MDDKPESATGSPFMDPEALKSGGHHMIEFIGKFWKELRTEHPPQHIVKPGTSVSIPIPHRGN